MRSRFFLLLFLISWSAQALELTQSQFCLQYDNGNGSAAVRIELLKRAIKVEGDINPHLLSVLEAMFRDYLVFGPLKVVQVESAGARKAWVEGVGKDRVLKLSTNAADLLLGDEIAKIVEKVCSKKLSQPMSFQVNWTNTVYEQILRELILPENLMRKFIQKTNWQLTSEPSDPDSTLEQEFRSEELPTLAKQLMDLPREVTDLMALKRIVRARVGRALPNNAAALYVVNQQKIILSDAALMDGASIYGEDTLLHEMGHAWWFNESRGVRQRFTEISWMKDGNGYIRKGSAGVGFITAYAMTSPEDDFAESFASYVHNAELLITKAPEKYEFIRQHIFKDVTYFSTVAKNAKVYIDSEKPDNRAPWIDGTLENCYSHKQRDLGSDVEIEITLRCVRDDLSGPAETLITLTHEKVDTSRVFVELKPLGAPDVNGLWTLRGTAKEAYSKLTAGRHFDKIFALKDRAGNSEHNDISKVSGMILKGEMGEAKRNISEIDWNIIKLTPIASVNGNPGYDFELPLAHEATLKNIHINWYHETTQERAVHVVDGERFAELASRPGDSQIKGSIYFHKEHAAGKVSLNSFTMFLVGSAQTAPSNHQFVRPRTKEVFVSLPGPGISLANVDVNSMKLTALKGKNSKGGDWSIKLKIPITQIPGTEFQIRISVRAPSGKLIHFYISEYLFKSNGAKILNHGGQDWLDVPLDLLPHPEKGEYLFESIEVETKVLYDRAQPSNLDQTDFIRRIKLLERGIRKEFTILPDESLQLR